MNKVFSYVPMTKEYAEEIAYNWKYQGSYSFYNMTEDEEDLQEFLDPATWKYSIYAVLDEKKQLIGFFQYNVKNFELVIGLGLKPELTGMGMGEDFVLSGIDFGINSFKDKINSIVLSVASFNKRAIKVYQKLGFETVKLEKIYTYGNNYDFVTMRKLLDLKSL